ncbi:Exocyst complex component EXO70B1 [Cucurbita argyrosperma subsp. argyrosperma]|uniref:Exocyst subunit Exo70 family protein n=1 Tax=Cucurbita moschata TaxID=3662 RepID=A0A6J1GAM2_CUCMO|nr:exocyst complex component EXO70B1-like [Cucurbita moschata]KAG7037022.1 Exocyst complex component EXO70B1 [Cucurbita argyrosperma subsp. argyrosperma]
MVDNGEEKLLAMARHIAKTMGRNESMADDILQIFSNFDARFSLDKLSDKSDEVDPRSSVALQRSLKSLDRRISQYLAADHPIWADSADSAAFLDAIDELIATIRDWTPMARDKSVGTYLARADDLMQQAMFRVSEEFRSLMERGGESFELTRHFRNRESTGEFFFDSEEDEEGAEGILGDGLQIPVAQPVTDYNVVIDALPSGTISDLHEIAKRMVAAGYEKECSHAFSSCRREFLEESLSRLGLQKLSIDEVQKMQWQDMEEEIERWMKAITVSLRILFPSERRLCERVFVGLSSAADLSFMEVCRGSTIQLLNFADAVAIGSRAPERLFKILDMFETLRDLMLDFDSVFSDQYCLLLRNEAIAIWKRLGGTIKGIFMELENLIRRDPAKTPVPGGGLHPITRYVMNYLKAACKSRQTLEQIFEEAALPSKDYTKLDDRATASSSLSVQMDWIMELLESNLEAKSKIYNDLSLSSVFLMNNGRYIVQKVKDSELGSVLGDDWIRKHSVKNRQYLGNFLKSSWSKVVGVLKIDSGSIAPAVMKEKLKSFNIQFEELCQTQSTWVISENQLREEAKISVTKILMPAYQNFIERYQSLPELSKRTDRHLMYTAKDVEAQITQLFQGGGGRR